MWIVTREISEYEQEGQYFVIAFIEKPSFSDLKNSLGILSDVILGKLTKGGGRQGREGEWFYLHEVEDGELFECQFGL